jgi:hypothetical protein
MMYVRRPFIFWLSRRISLLENADWNLLVRQELSHVYYLLIGKNCRDIYQYKTFVSDGNSLSTVHVYLDDIDVRQSLSLTLPALNVELG